MVLNLHKINEFLNIYPHLIWKPEPVLYDCSNRTLEEWYARGEAHPVKGWTALIFGVSAIITYIITLLSISSKEFLRQPCYRMMYFTSLNDIFNLFVSNIVTGYYFIVGANFCTHPVGSYVFGALAIGGWNSMSVSVMALALGRLAEITDRGKCLFKGKMTCFWIIPSILAFIFSAFFTHGLTFNSKAGAWLFIPVILDNMNEELKIFRNYCFLGIADLMCFIITCTYICMIIQIWSKKSRSASSPMSRTEKNLFIQCSLISLTLCSTAFLYNMVLLLEVPNLVKAFAQVSYQVSECGPLLGYLIFNHTIRRKFLGTVRISSTN